MPLTDYRSTASTLLILPSHHHLRQHLRRRPPERNFQPPVQLSLARTTIVCHDYLLQPLLICWARRWEDSNAESFRTQNFNYNSFGGDDEDEDTEDDYILEEWDDVFQEYIDSIWICKVFRSYGWALPFILVPLVVTNGPKSFLLALALPIWQSTFSFAVQKMWGGKRKRSKRKNKARSTSSSTVEDKFWKDKREESKMGYKSWVPSDDDSSFGGWEWDKVDSSGSEFELGHSSRSGKRVGRSQKSASEKSRLGERVRGSDAPLLLKLLIAVFPFLVSWTKIL